KIHIVGDPRIENYRQLKLDKIKVYKTLKIKQSKKIVLLISFRSTWMIPKSEKRAFFKLASIAIANLPNTVLVVKPHPTEKRYRIKGELREWGITNVVVSDNNQLELVDLLNASSVILQTWSMTIFEAIMMSKPVISINPHKKDYNHFLPVLGFGGAKEVNSLSELSKWLTTFLRKNHPKTKLQLEKAKKASQRFIKSPDGKVAQRVVDLLY
ncbi:CDP-glycerol glycerophosphotransferase family protein, partial [Patescibacteria group bacterium]|nr:CDP-glycerol glycerophosphotransferase family protein [Patescibacteria group bacterium]